MTLDTAYVTGDAALDPLAADIPDSVTPGNPIEAVWGNEVVEALREHEAEIAAMIPTGTIWQFAGQTAPARWEICDGTDRESTDPKYAKLFGVLGYMYGQNGTRFKLPDFRGRLPAGVSGGDAAFGIGHMSGVRDAPLIKHDHGMKNHTHYIEIADEGDHRHYVPGAGVGVNSGPYGQIYGTRGEPANWPVFPSGQPQPPGVKNSGVIFTATSFLQTVPPGLPLSIMPDGWMEQGITVNIPPQWSYTAREQGQSWHRHGLARNDGPNDNTTNQAGTADSGSDANLPPYTTVNFMIRL